MLKLTAALNQAISAYYQNDLSAPSLITSYIAKTGEWYFSIARYSRRFGAGKYIVVNGKGKDYTEGLKALASDWLRYIGGPSKHSDVKRLQKILNEP
jgi:hypothetical protein